jgi:hypothetical protein
MPLVAFVIMATILSTVAAPSVTSSPGWILFYIVVGFGWIQCVLHLVFRCFDLSWIDDVVGKNHTEPALLPVIGSLSGITLIYAGSNIGDGPGWWCVIYASAIATLVWFILGHIIQKTTDAFSTITIGRDLPCAIRMGAYLLASGAILAYAAAGDSIDVTTDIVNIAICSLTAIPLAILAIFVERYYRKSKCTSRNMACSFSATGMKCAGKFAAFAWSIVYLIVALGAIFVSDAIMQVTEGSVWGT